MVSHVLSVRLASVLRGSSSFISLSEFGKISLAALMLILRASAVHGEVAPEQGKILYETRCAICHGADARGTGPLAQASMPPANDLTSPAFRERLAKYPGVIVASVVLMPNGTLIPDTLKKAGVKMPAKEWKASELRALNTYLVRLIKKENNLPTD